MIQTQFNPDVNLSLSNIKAMVTGLELRRSGGHFFPSPSGRGKGEGIKIYLPHPALRATFSLGEKENDSRYDHF